MQKFYMLFHRRTALSKIFLCLLSVVITCSASAQAGNALQYTGTGLNGVNGLPNQQYLTLPNGIVQGVNGSFTIEAWVFWSSVSAWQRIFDFGTSTSNFMFLTPSSNANMMRFGIVAGATEVIDAAIQLPNNAWTHVAVSVDATNTGRIFINGVLQGTGTIAQRPSALGNTTANYIGKSQFVSDPTFNGVIDEFRISNIARYTSNFTPSQTQFTNDGNTVALFHFNEGTGQQTFDVTNTLAGTLGFSTSVEPDLDPTWFANSILPVRIENLSAQRTGTSIELKWKATGTGDPGKFLVERSNDGKLFNPLGELSIINQAGRFEYSFKDALPGTARNYYRIKILEYNMAATLSQVVWVDMHGREIYTINPTAASSELFVSIPKETIISFYNTSGILMKRMQVQASQNINVEDLARGLYYVQFGGSKQTERFIKL
jgi:hypothetical protein